MDFEKESKKERTLALVMHSAIESVADRLHSEAIILVDEPGLLRFQPYIIPEPGSQQRIGPTPEFITTYISLLIQSLEEINDTINWKESVISSTSPEGIVTIQIDFTKLY